MAQPMQRPPEHRLAWWARLHQALMPDYNRQATVYWWLMVLLGLAVLSGAVHHLLGLPGEQLGQVAGGVVIAMLAGLFPVRIPRSKNSFAAGEIFIFLLLLLHGPAAATVAAAGEGLIGAWRTSRRWTSRIVSPATASIAMFVVGSALHAAIGMIDAQGAAHAAQLLAATMASALLYFVLNTGLVAAVPYLKRRHWPSLRELFGDFGWVGITFAGSASIACLLFLAFQRTGLGLLTVAGPIIAMLLAMLHYFSRQQEADERIRQGRLEAAEREAALSASHVLQLRQSEQRFHSAFTHASIGMALVAFDTRVLQVNAALCALLGAEDGSALAQRPFGDFVHPEHADQFGERLQRLASQEIQSLSIDLQLRHQGGAEVWAALHGSLFSEADSATPCLILQVQDITARRLAESGLQHLAFHDSLTGLPNRRRLHEQLALALARAQREPLRHFSLMFIDFDRFKLINDSLGHAVGDEFLVQVSRRIQQCVRPQDMVARLGGDEFAILAEDLGGERYAVTLAERLLEVLRQPLQMAGTEIGISASIGITFSATGYATPQDMLRDADIAMYKAKACGKARYALFDGALHTEAAHRLRLEGDLRRAIAAGELSVAYQPLFDLASGRLTGFEALARWVHPELGAIGPDSFIPIAEDAGLIMPLTDLVLRRACHQLKDWQSRDARLAELHMHVNVSGNDIAHPSLVPRITSALVQARLQAQHLTLELTENILMERLEAASDTLAELRRLGVGLSVDDFGTGYSSLRHLSTLPVNSLKIDRAFLTDLQRDADGSAVVHAIIQLGHTLGKKIIAEGIENEAQLEQLIRMGCGGGQGFHLARPLAPELIDRLLDKLIATGDQPHARQALANALLVH